MLPNKTAKQIGERLAGRFTFEMAMAVGGPMDGQALFRMGNRQSCYEQTQGGKLLMHRYELKREPGVREVYLYAGAVEVTPSEF